MGYCRAWDHIGQGVVHWAFGESGGMSRVQYPGLKQASERMGDGREIAVGQNLLSWALKMMGL